MEPIPVGTDVLYQGSHAHGTYVVVAHHAPDDSRYPYIPPDVLADAYPDGVAYEIWLKGVLVKFGNRDYSVHRVRRGSLTPIGEK